MQEQKKSCARLGQSNAKKKEKMVSLLPELMKKKNHRILEYSKLKGTHQDH